MYCTVRLQYTLPVPMVGFYFLTTSIAEEHRTFLISVAVGTSGEIQAGGAHQKVDEFILWRQAAVITKLSQVSAVQSGNLQ